MKPMDLAFRLLKMNYQEALDAVRIDEMADPNFGDTMGFRHLRPGQKRILTPGELHPHLPSPHGRIMYFHGTDMRNYPSIQQHGLLANEYDVAEKLKVPRVGDQAQLLQALSSGSNRSVYDQLFGNIYASTALGNVLDYYSKPRPSRQGNALASKPGLVGIRQAAGTPEPYFGIGDWDEGREKRKYPYHWRFTEDISPEHLVFFDEETINEAAKHIAEHGNSAPLPYQQLPEFYDEQGNPPDFGDMTGSEFNLQEWQDKYGKHG